jgi:integrase/recombinase XerD
MRRGEPTSLLDGDGQRKYVSRCERRRFLAETARQDPATAALCKVLAYTGCRLSEALALTPSRLDLSDGRIIFRTLKRRRPHHRAVPVPPELLKTLLALTVSPDEPFWPWSRQTAWRRVKQVMEAARIADAQAMPKALRHGFGITNAEENVPPALTQRWMGHARLETTAIYQQAVGAEERVFAMRLWRE